MDGSELIPDAETVAEVQADMNRFYVRSGIGFLGYAAIVLFVTWAILKKK
jgi:hypothetical protein